MKKRVEHVYLMLGNILNNPRAFGLEERPPKPLREVLSRMQQELMEELRDEATNEDVLAKELSQDADPREQRDFTAVCSTSFTVRGED